MVRTQSSNSFSLKGALYRGGVILLALTILTSAVAWAAPPQRSHARAARGGGSSSPVAPITTLALQPANATLDGSYAFQTLAVVGNAADGSARDLTESATFSSSNPGVVRIGKDGVAYPVSDGAADVVASVGGRSARARFTVRNFRTNANLTFENAITPILVKNGCVGSACHGAPNGQAGFKLSFFGYEAQKDWEAIVKGDKGRRIDLAHPMESLLIRKPTNLAGHGGGKRFAPDGPEARVFAAWIKAGAPFLPGDGTKRAQAGRSGPQLAGYAPDPKRPAPSLVSIDVTPGQRLIRQANTRHQLLVTAHYSDGSERDVTPFARYASDDDGIATIAGNGKLTALRKGEANIMVRFAGKVGLASVVVQPQPPMAHYPQVPANNFIDEAVFAKLKTLNIVPSDLCDDATFIRRAYFDICGTPPLPGAVRQFLADTASNKRAKLIDELLERPEYKDYQTILWADLLRNSRVFLQEPGVRAYTRFIRESFADNKPFDQFVRELLTGTGSTYRNETAAANYYRVTSDPSELTTSTSQIFLGVRLECCRCHNHPFDRWKQDDFYGFAAFFAKTHLKGGPAKDELIVYTDGNGGVTQPRTGQAMRPKFLTADQPLADESGDVRVKLAAWMTAPDNPFFAKATVNRVWKQFLGRGIVHPVDDFRATNPPINAPLLDALAKDFVAHGYDMKRLIRTICNSRVYQLSSTVNATNAEDTKNFSHYYIKRLGPEALLDAICIATGVEEQFGGVRPGTRAINLPDNNVGSYFLDVFGRSRRLNVQERSQETSMSQALALMNGTSINGKITDPNGRIAQLIGRLGDRSEEAIVSELYLATLARYPNDKELKRALDYIHGSPSPRDGYEDLMWAMLNSREFLFNH
jgi:hypothetical protein